MTAATTTPRDAALAARAALLPLAGDLPALAAAASEATARTLRPSNEGDPATTPLGRFFAGDPFGCQTRRAEALTSHILAHLGRPADVEDEARRARSRRPATRRAYRPGQLLCAGSGCRVVVAVDADGDARVADRRGFGGASFLDCDCDGVRAATAAEAEDFLRGLAACGRPYAYRACLALVSDLICGD